MTTTLGHIGQHAHKQYEYLALSFSPLSAPLRSRWRNNGVSADFLGDYVTTFLPTSSNTGGGKGIQSDIRHAVTYIANEFLENAMKYHEHDVDIPIGLRLELTSDEISVSASNCIGAGPEIRYRAFIEKILTQDPGDLLLKQLEGGSRGIESSVSCLGLLTMITDYGARLGWRFEPHAEYPQLTIATTSAILPVGKTGVATV